MNSESLLTPENIAKNWQVSTAFIYKLVREKKIPYYHIGKTIRFSAAEIDNKLPYHDIVLKKI